MMARKNLNEPVLEPKSILYPLSLDRVGNPISTIHRNLAIQFVTNSPRYSIFSFAHDVNVLKTQFGDILERRPNALKLICVPENKFLQVVAIHIHAIANLNSWDAVHIVPNPALLPLIGIAKLFGKKVITTIHEAPSHTQSRDIITRTMLRLLASSADICTSVSSFVEKQVITHWHISSRVIANGIDTQFFSPKFSDKRAVEKKYGLDTKTKKLILYVGALIAGKGAEIVAATCVIRSDISCLIVGKGPLKSKIQDIVGASSHVKQIDYISPEDLRVLYATSDVLFFPSSIDSFGLVYLESLASGTPVLSVYEAAAPEIITKREYGILVRTPAAFAVSLTALLRAKTHKAELVNYVKKNFSWTHIATQYEKAYDDLLNVNLKDECDD